jgi:hypothetical protein
MKDSTAGTPSRSRASALDTAPAWLAPDADGCAGGLLMMDSFVSLAVRSEAGAGRHMR